MRNKSLVICLIIAAPNQQIRQKYLAKFTLLCIISGVPDQSLAEWFKKNSRSKEQREFQKFKYRTIL
jgi:hypothetical protein